MIVSFVPSFLLCVFLLAFFGVCAYVCVCVYLHIQSRTLAMTAPTRNGIDCLTDYVASASEGQRLHRRDFRHVDNLCIWSCNLEQYLLNLFQIWQSYWENIICRLAGVRSGRGTYFHPRFKFKVMKSNFAFGTCKYCREHEKNHTQEGECIPRDTAKQDRVSCVQTLV